VLLLTGLIFLDIPVRGGDGHKCHPTTTSYTNDLCNNSRLNKKKYIVFLSGIKFQEANQETDVSLVPHPTPSRDDLIVY
jgi:hypothetical protein